MQYKKLGHKKIDHEHEELIKQIGELNKLISNRTEDETIIKRLDLVLALAVKHYVTEEQEMERLPDYPDRELHIQEHRLVIQHIADFRQTLQQEIVTHQLKFNNAMRFWTNHIFAYDEPLVNLILNRKSKINNE